MGCDLVDFKLDFEVSPVSLDGPLEGKLFRLSDRSRDEEGKTRVSGGGDRLCLLLLSFILHPVIRRRLESEK